MNVLAVIMADNKYSDLGILSQNRSEAAVPFAGKYRVIDFALSNCVNSGVCDIGIFTQYQPHSLNEHIRTGRPWDLERKLSGGVTLLPPYQRNGHSLDWYRGTADAIYQNLDFIRNRGADTIIALSGGSVYKMDYDPLLQYHKQRQADVTISAVSAPLGRPFSPNAFITDGDGRVLELLEQPCDLPNARYFMGLYVFKASVLMQRLAQDTRSFSSTHDLSQDVLPRMLELGDRVYAYDFRDYAANVGTVQAYWQANTDLLLPEPPLDIQDRRWHIHTRNEEGRPPVNICPNASVSNSLISDGCIIQGRVESSVLSPGVRVREGALVRDSVILSDCEIKPGAIVDRVILDKHVVVGQNAHVGADLSETVYLGHLHTLAPGITLVGKNTSLPAGLRIGRDCVVCGDPTKDDFIIHNQHIGTPASQTWAISSDSRTLHTTAVLQGVGRGNG